VKWILSSANNLKEKTTSKSFLFNNSSLLDQNPTIFPSSTFLNELIKNSNIQPLTIIENQRQLNNLVHHTGESDSRLNTNSVLDHNPDPYNTNISNDNKKIDLLNEEVSDFVKELKSQREDIIKNEIRLIQKDAYLLETELLEKFNKQKQQIISNGKIEETSITNSIKNYEDTISQLVVKKNTISDNLKCLKSQFQKMKKDIYDKSNLASELRNQLKSYQNKKLKLEEEHNNLLSDQEKKKMDKLHQYQQEIKILENQILTVKKGFEINKTEIERHHIEYLDTLDQQVKVILLLFTSYFTFVCLNMLMC
jgi:chromosome segregation ATPase